jgi:hypothetical protein
VNRRCVGRRSDVRSSEHHGGVAVA